MRRANVVPHIRKLAEGCPIREALYAMASPDVDIDVRPRLHDAEWLLMKEFGGLQWWSNLWPEGVHLRPDEGPVRGLSEGPRS